MWRSSDNSNGFGQLHNLTTTALPKPPNFVCNTIILCRNAVCGLLSTPELAGSSNKYTITARRTYLETGHVATDDAILNFIQALEEHKRMCESEGKYMEARAAAKRIATVKVCGGELLTIPVGDPSIRRLLPDQFPYIGAVELMSS